MSDQQPQPPEGPAATPAPMPIPVGVAAPDGQKRRRWPWIVGALVLVGLLCGCIAAVWLLDDSLEDV